VIVVDASALVEVLLRTPSAAAVQDRLFNTEQTLHAPHLIDVEVMQVLRLTNLASLFEIHPSLVEALDSRDEITHVA